MAVGHIGELSHPLRVARPVEVEIDPLIRVDILSGIGVIPAFHDDVVACAVPCAGERVVPGQRDVAPVIDALPMVGLPVRHGHEEGGVRCRSAGVGPEVVHLDMAGARDGGFRRVSLHDRCEHAEHAAQHEQERHGGGPEAMKGDRLSEPVDSCLELFHDGLLSVFTTL